MYWLVYKELYCQLVIYTNWLLCISHIIWQRNKDSLSTIHGLGISEVHVCLQDGACFKETNERASVYIRYVKKISPHCPISTAEINPVMQCFSWLYQNTHSDYHQNATRNKETQTVRLLVSKAWKNQLLIACGPALAWCRWKVYFYLWNPLLLLYCHKTSNTH